MIKNLKIEKCEVVDLDPLVELGKLTYFETFKDYCSDDVMSKYLNEAFEKNKIHQEITNKDSEFYFIYVDHEISGYLKLNINDAQSDLKNENGLEIERIYIKEHHKSNGLGRLLIEYGLTRAKQLMKNFVWLGVWEKNLAAINFYEKRGFHKIGSHSFRMGDEMQNDFIMKKELIE